MTGHAEALARSTLLLNREYFDGQASEPAIADGLLATTIRLQATQANLLTRAGQAALITAFGLIARMGVGVEPRPCEDPRSARRSSTLDPTSCRAPPCAPGTVRST